MRLLWPEPGRGDRSGDADPALPSLGSSDGLDAFVAGEARPAPPGRPWVAVNTICSLDGAITVDGRSGGLQAPADLAMFGSLRAAADVIVVGAGTARTEGYGPARPTAARRGVRSARGQLPVPPIAVVSRSLELDTTTPLFDPAAGTIVVTCAAASPERRAQLADHAEVVVAGEDEVDLHEAMADLARRGHRFALCEGGPRLNADLVAADLVDEWCLSLSPLLVGGASQRAATGAAPAVPRGFELARVLLAEAMLLVRHVRVPDAPGP